ncbi:PREDICTED: putative glucose-6-phosphate 1-epimerase [Erythranthe guttata]|uniref:putative glucose-6-phosphate 1-epimerase n=1 Tax=Erythranthe guttata TaxID=4155 RepID=UPI00064DCDD4|nr:PREDICTED: putative glucose-6-phosphate 1-epimerase [Erythranthe guttata]|eukprot:XP_012857283.1 PREDICTED: putative glucose-6-phosphate 1-epimerase [Erythranthe guttata]
MASSSSSSSAPEPEHEHELAPRVDWASRVFVHIHGVMRSIILRQPCGYSAEVLLYGGQVVSWVNERGDQLLFLSEKEFEANKPICGGIPICFPKFSNDGNIEQHGFACTRFWTIDASIDSVNEFDKASVDLILTPTEDDLLVWPHRFEFRLEVKLEPNGELKMKSRIRNVNDNGMPFKFPFSYHNYFSVSDVSDVRIEGLEVLDYVDYMKNNERFNQGSDVVTFESQVNRAYFNTIGMIAVMDHLALRTYTIRKSRGLPDIVVWNPWEKELSQWDWKMEDLAKGNYRKFVCVEAANVENEITLKPFEEWIGIQHLSAHPGSYDDHLPNPGSIL